MRILYFLFLLSASTVATASIPSSKSYGSWRVISISSEDGVSGNDPAVILTQGDDSNELQVRWSRGVSIDASIYIEKCKGEDSFEASETMESPEDVETRLRTKFRLWIDEAKRTCGSRPPFKMKGLDAAVRDLTALLRFYVASSSRPLLETHAKEVAAAIGSGPEGPFRRVRRGKRTLPQTPLASHCARI